MSRPAAVPPRLISPMLVTLGDLPQGAGRAYEFKWDGVRAVTYTGPGGHGCSAVTTAMSPPRTRN
jgi:ATP-dependent DNA ligase